MQESIAAGSARAKLLRWIARAIGDGVQSGIRDQVSPFRDLSALLGPSRPPDEEAAAHYDLFSFRVPPYAGLFLGDGKQVGAADSAHRHYAAAGFRPTRNDLAADHLAIEIEFVAWCSEGGEPLADVARTFLDDELIGWLPTVTQATREQGESPYTAILELLWEVVVEYRSRLGESSTASGRDLLPPMIDPLAEERSGARDIAAHLVTPAQVGFYIGRGDIRRIGRTIECPTGFGGRDLMLTNLLLSAASYDRLGDLAQEIDALAGRFLTNWQTCAESGAGTASAWTETWSGRIEATREMLQRMVIAVQDESP